MGVPKYRITLDEEERNLLRRISRKHTERQSIVRRAKIILRANEGCQYQDIAKGLGINEQSVTIWIKRWLERDSDPVEDRLEDLPRSGTPDRISPEQWCRIIALSCERPSEYGLPITDWTHRELANEAIKQGIVEAISPSHIGSVLKKRHPTPSNAVLAKCEAGRTQRREDSRDL
jgi:putative transposase